MIDFPENQPGPSATTWSATTERNRSHARVATESTLRVIGSTSERSGYFRFKPVVDWGIAALFLVPALPLLVVTSLVILVFDGRPVFYRQERVGKLGRRFRIWKFRTMFHDAESDTGPIWCSANDQRVTRLGKWLRRSHLDELPQLLNILSGDMNLIGPRPERPQFVAQLSRDIPNYEDRLLVRPGITGLAQIKQGYDTSIADVRRKVELDVEYIRQASLAKDLMILFSTLPHVLIELANSRRDRRTAELARENQLSEPDATAAVTPAPKSAKVRRRGVSSVAEPGKGSNLSGDVTQTRSA